MVLSNMSLKCVLFTVTTVLVLTLVLLSHLKPFEYSSNNKHKLPFHIAKGPQTPANRLYLVPGRDNRESHPVQTMSRFFPTLQMQAGMKHLTARMGNRNAGGNDTQGYTTTAPTTPTTVTTALPTAPSTPPPVSLRLPSGHMVTPESLSLPENSSDLLITVKTAGSLGESRLSLAFLTWMQTIDPKHIPVPPPVLMIPFLKRQKVRIITDSGAGRWFSAAKERGIAVIKTDCTGGHKQTALCCKTGTEFEQYYKARDRGEHCKWFCHTDDDVYINMPNLVKKLHSYTPGEKRYLGYWLTKLWGKGRMKNGNYNNFPGHVRKGYYYGTGAFYCMSASLMDAAEKYFRGKNAFVTSCNKANLPDDDTVGLITDAVLDVPLTHVKEMNSELSYKTVPAGAFKDQISFGYSTKRWHVRINVQNERFSRSNDPSGMLSYHCLLYPQTSWCTK